MDCLPTASTDKFEKEICQQSIANIAATQGVDLADKDVGPSGCDIDDRNGNDDRDNTTKGRKYTEEAISPAIFSEISSKIGTKSKSEGDLSMTTLSLPSLFPLHASQTVS